MNAVQRAEAAIATILRDLERVTASPVSRVDINTLDISTSAEYRMLRTVDISLQIGAAHQWPQADEQDLTLEPPPTP